MFVYALGLITFLVFGINCAKHKPASSYFSICDKTGTELDKCIQNSMTEAKSVLRKGIPEIGLPSIDPLFIKHLELSQGQGRLKFRQILSNLNIYGMNDYDVLAYHADMDKMKYTTTLFTKNIVFEGDYEIDAQILIMPIKGSGKLINNFTDITYQIIGLLEKFDKKGSEYLRIKNITLTVEPKTASFNLTNLFNGNKELGDAANKFLNENWREAYDVFRDISEETFGQLLVSLSNIVYETFPAKELYPSIFKK